jgi:DNA-binding XRE family transcriptional regulator
MRKIAEVLRLHHECSSSQRDIALAVGVSPTSVCPTALTVRDKPEVATVFASAC